MTRIKVFIGSFFSSFALVPALALAQGNGLNLDQGGLSGALDYIWTLVNQVIPILIGLGVVVFLFGVLKFIFAANDPDKRKEGRSFMIWGLIGIVVMVSVWGLVRFVQSTFGISDEEQAQQGPEIPPQR